MATPVSIGNFITEIISNRGGPSNPTLYEFTVAPSATSNIKESMKGFGIEWDQELRFLNYLNNEIQIPSGHTLELNGNMKVPVWTEGSKPQNPETGLFG